MAQVTQNIPQLHIMKKYPKELFYEGNLTLLERTKISIVGTRKPSKYSRMETLNLSNALAKAGFCIVSGGAMGIDAIAHNGAKVENTIGVLPCGIDIQYPKVNKSLLQNIAQKGLLLSQFNNGEKARPWSFVVRNELVVALGEILIVTEADLKSGTMRSVEFALEQKKEIYVLPHRLGESLATQKLLQNNQAKAIYNIEDFVFTLAKQYNLHTEKSMPPKNNFLQFCHQNPTYEEAYKKFPSEIFEAELEGKIFIKNGIVYLA